MSRYKSARSKATDIPISVKRIVYARDNGRCVWCGRPGFPNAHAVSRAKGGKGIEENIVTMCVECHNAMDNGSDTEKSKQMMEYVEHYLKMQYPDWQREKVVYSKWT